MISMKKCLSTIIVMLFVISCSDNQIANKAPTFGYHIDKIVRVNEGDTSIGTFQAIDVDGDEINYAISNTDMGITQDGEVTFNIVPDFETEEFHSAVITASNDAGSDEINLTVYINNSDCEFDTASVFNICRLH